MSDTHSDARVLVAGGFTSGLPGNWASLPPTANDFLRFG